VEVHIAPNTIDSKTIKRKMAMTQHSGSCLCGSVKYQLDGDFHNFFLCHCSYCQKDTGSAHAANLFSKDAQLTWLKGQDKVTFYNLPETRHGRSFCSICGSPVPTSLGDGKLVMVPAGSMDTPVTIKPTAHLFIASKADWEKDLDQVHRFQGYPE